MKSGKGWGIEYADGQCVVYGWLDPEKALIFNPKFCKKTTDAVHKGSYYEDDLKTAELVNVERVTEVIIK